MEIYNIKMFEVEILKNRNRFILRNGAFVGIFKYIKNDSILTLTKNINKETYGYRKEFDVKNEGEFLGGGGDNGVSCLVECNELHIIPKGYNLRENKHLKILDSCLGGCHSEVRGKIKKCNPINYMNSSKFF